MKANEFRSRGKQLVILALNNERTATENIGIDGQNNNSTFPSSTVTHQRYNLRQNDQAKNGTNSEIVDSDKNFSTDSSNEFINTDSDSSDSDSMPAISYLKKSFNTTIDKSKEYRDFIEEPCNTYPELEEDIFEVYINNIIPDIPSTLPLTPIIAEQSYTSPKSPVIPTINNIEVLSDLLENTIPENAKEKFSQEEMHRKVHNNNLTERTNNIDRVIVKFGEIVNQSREELEFYKNARPWTKRNACPYCFREVTHFARHLQRIHKEEGAVRELLVLPINNPKRKLLLNVIRRQGNYFLSRQSNIIKPVRRPRGKENETLTDNLQDGKEQYVTCPDCFGYFKRDFLRRHRKLCKVYPKNKNKRENHLTESQMLNICAGEYSDFYNSLRLKDEVFKIMRSDEISKAAMKDILICSYAENLLLKHKRLQIRNTISNKMRELGRLLLKLKALTGINQLFDALKPEFFDNIVTCTKLVSGYNAENRTYKAGSFALHMGTTLKQVCDISSKMIIKKSRFLQCEDREMTLKNIKRIKNLIENHWNSEISSLALKDLNEKRWEKPKLLPLTSDVMKFQQYLVKIGKESCQNIINERSLQSEYRRLSEIVLSLTVLLNRKRIGEVQYLKLKTYTAETALISQEEFLESLSNSEKILTKNFKRVITAGKGSKPVAILFPKNVQQFINAILNVRSRCVPDTNEYLFANPETENRWLSGYHVLRKLAKESGVKDQSLFTSTRLRKQIATILQIMNISDMEMEQFAAFMGHTKKTHAEYYRLPQDVFQTAKVSKLLVAINRGKGIQYKGKTLDEIEMSDDVESDDSSISDEQQNDQCEELEELKQLDEQLPQLEPHQTSKIITISKRTKPTIERIRWTDEQKQVIRTYFSDHIKNKKAPKKNEVEELMKRYKTLFKEKNWIKIKAFVYNCYK